MSNRKIPVVPADGRLTECSRCEGRGEIWAPKKKICEKCNGKGFVPRKGDTAANPGIFEHWADCPWPKKTCICGFDDPEPLT